MSERKSVTRQQAEANIDMNLLETTGESGDEMDMSVCGEKADIRLPVDDLRGASRAMACTTRSQRSQPS